MRKTLFCLAIAFVMFAGSFTVQTQENNSSDSLKQALDKVAESVYRRNELEQERKTLLEDYPPTHAKVKAVEKKIIAEGVLYAGYAKQAAAQLGAEIEKKETLLKANLAEGMREDGKVNRELKETIEQLKRQKMLYANAFQPESYAEIGNLFAGMKKTVTIIGKIQSGTKAGERMTLNINDVECAFRWCPAGEFVRGSDEKQQRVTLTKGFWMGETEVTQEQWESVMGEIAHHYGCNFRGEKLPAECISWNDCQEFIKKLNEFVPSGYKFALPTEAQWEYACRAGSTTAYCFGDSENQLSDYAWYDKNSGRKTHEVGKKKPNAWGLRDMHGNVWEWCSDWYRDYAEGSVTDPVGAGIGSYRVFRGGYWYLYAEYCRSAARSNGTPADRFNSLGVRVILVSETSK